MELWRIWLGMLTRDVKNAGTDSDLKLLISLRGVEIFDETISLGGMTLPRESRPADDLGQQPDQERREANLYDLLVGGMNLHTDDLDVLSISLGIAGSDAWSPEHFFAWGEGADSQDIIPLAIETEINTTLSTDSGEGSETMALRSVAKGGADMLINRLLILTLTEASSESTGNFLFGADPNPVFGTDDPFQITISDASGVVVSSEIVDTSQTDLNTGHANYYTAPVVRPFRFGDLSNNSATLRIKGRDNWYPKSLFVFGLDAASGRPGRVVPMVHLTYWPFGVMQPDSTTGVASQILPLLPRSTGRSPIVGPARVADLLKASISNWRRSRNEAQ